MDERTPRELCLGGITRMRGNEIVTRAEGYHHVSLRGEGRVCVALLDDSNS